MLNYRTLILIIFFSSAKIAFGQSTDTLITFHKFTSSSISVSNVSTVDSADFVRVVYPADPISKDYPVKEFYKDGKIKLVGKYESGRYYRSKLGVFNGDCISYYPTGKRRSFTHYLAGRKVGQEYIFYPTGLVNYSIMYEEEPGFKPKFWEFFTTNGEKTCEKGNGHWITYDDNYKPIVEGEVKNGLFEGAWNGKTFEADSIKYTYLYKKGEVVSATGYDKFAKAYPFKEFIDESSIKIDPFKFVEKLRKKFKIPKEINIKKRSLDSALVSFILEKDGRFSNAEIVGNNEPELKLILQNALNECTGETPKRYYGVPLRSKITVSFNDISQTIYTHWESYSSTPSQSFGDHITPARYDKRSVTKKLTFKEEILGFD